MVWDYIEGQGGHECPRCQLKKENDTDAKTKLLGSIAKSALLAIAQVREESTVRVSFPKRLAHLFREEAQTVRGSGHQDLLHGQHSFITGAAV
jgi:hypothetical protein